MNTFDTMISLKEEIGDHQSDHMWCTLQSNSLIGPAADTATHVPKAKCCTVCRIQRFLIAADILHSHFLIILKILKTTC